MIALLASSLAACTQGQKSERQVVGRFVGSFDATSGKLTVTPVPSSLASRVQAAIAPIPDPIVPGAGVGDPDTVELVTMAVRYDSACGKAGSICADVVVRSFYTANELHNVFVMLDSVSDPANNGFWTTANPAPGQPGNAVLTSNNGGLWGYPALLDATRGAYPGGDVPGANAAMRTWYFGNPSNANFTFTGRVWAEVVPTALTTGLQGICPVSAINPLGGATALDTLTNCGECERASNGSSCTYTNAAGTSQGRSLLTFTPACGAGLTACDTGDAMAFACTNLQNTDANCGVCGNACGGGNTCVAGTCTAAGACSTAGASNCGATCCPAGSTCTAGLCILSDGGDIAVGSAQACAVTATTTRVPYQDEDGGGLAGANNVVCWGKSWASGSAAANISAGFPSGVPVPVSNLPALSSLSSGGTATFGNNDASHATLGWGTTEWSPNYYTGFYNYIAPRPTVGGSHVCFFSTEFNRYVACRGANGSGQLGDGTTLPSGNNDRVVRSVGDSGLVQETLLDAADGPGTLSAAGDTSCAVLAQRTEELPVKPAQTGGTVACWGSNASGQAGGSGGPYLYPVLVLAAANALPLQGISAVSVGGNHTVALSAGGNLYTWGSNGVGQFGAASPASSSDATLIDVGGSATAVTAGQDFTCYLRADQTVWCAGANGRGQLGDGTTTNRSAFVQVIGLSGVTALVAGGVPATGNTAYGSTCALVAPHVYCWGDNSLGQVGTGVTGGFYTTPQLVQLAPVP